MQTVRKKGKRKYWTGGNEIERKRVRKKEEEFTKGVKKRTGEERGRRRQGSRREVWKEHESMEQETQHEGCAHELGETYVCALMCVNAPRALCAASVLVSWLNTPWQLPCGTPGS